MTHLGLPVDLVAAQAQQVNLAPAIVARAYSAVGAPWSWASVTSPRGMMRYTLRHLGVADQVAEGAVCDLRGGETPVQGDGVREAP